MTHLLYLHGFLSSEKSVKALQTKAFFREHYPDVTLHIPRLSNYPGEVRTQLETLLAENPGLLSHGLRLIGSSMGGYLSTWLAETYGGKAVLVNPAVRPYALLEGYLGEHVNPYTNERFTLVEDDIHALQALDTPVITLPARYRVLLQTGDETLDYRQAEEKYQGADLVIEDGGDHSFVNYEAHLPAIARFLLGD
ncbi:YqiA/YcfP family alpha/beta fold hydrolase [Alteromonas sp. CYL-A6]|uniref:YqiA/YcfP family alpha/beta fold hydrolase n=1 Tax=Alteromonas nitratireducens TaxID=3390813 RepID=UPI0034AAF2D1